MARSVGGGGGVCGHHSTCEMSLANRLGKVCSQQFDHTKNTMLLTVQAFTLRGTDYLAIVCIHSSVTKVSIRMDASYSYL